MHPPGAETVLVRYGEIGLKSGRVQSRMEGRLRDNIAASLDTAGFDDPVERAHTRLYVHTASDRIERVTDVVTDVFGVVSASPTIRVDPTMDDICDTLASAAVEHYDGGTFAVRARRAGSKSAHPFSSTDVETQGGNTVWETATDHGVDPAVDLEAPDLTFHVECRPEDAFVFLDRQAGPGGLPVGTQQPLVALVSGGLDSPVAAWSVMKRGCPVAPLYIDLGAYGGVDHQLRARQTVSRLQRYAPNHDLRLRVAPGGEGVDRIVEATDHCRMPVLRRFMYRIAEHVAESIEAEGIVTGDSIGQKSSQTSSNLRVSSAVTPFPVHRPLLAVDKTEITDRARDIGTYHDSTIDAGCNRIAPDQPATRPTLSTITDLEPDDIEQLARDAAAQVEVLDHVDSGA